MAVVRVGAEDFRRELTQLLNKVGYSGDHVVVKRHNEEIAAVVPFELYQQLDLAKWTMPARGAAQDQSAGQDYFPVEEVPRLAAEIEASRVAAGITYETLAEGLRAERLRTLREKYPDYAAKHEASQSG